MNVIVWGHANPYEELVDVSYASGTSLALVGRKYDANEPLQQAPSSALNNTLIHIAAGNVSVSGMTLNVNQPMAGSGIVAGITAAALDAVLRNNITLAYDTIYSSGTTAGKFYSPNADLGSACTAIALAGNGLMSAAIDINNVSISNTSSAPFGYGIWAWNTGGIVAGNAIVATSRDVYVQSAFGPSMAVQNNNFNGAGVEIRGTNAACSVFDISGNALNSAQTAGVRIGRAASIRPARCMFRTIRSRKSERRVGD